MNGTGTRITVHPLVPKKRHLQLTTDSPKAITWYN